MNPGLRSLVEEFRRGSVGRREFIQRVVVAAGGLAAATPLLASLGIGESEAAQVDPNDPALDSKSVQFPGKAGSVWAYRSRPKSGTNLPMVIVVHENRGLSPHIEDVARRFARQGYIALAPDYLSRQGGTAKFPEAPKGLGNIRELAPAQRTPKHELLQRIEAPILAHYGEEDKGITGAVPETAEAMKRYGKSFTYKVFPRAKHAFHNDTGDRYHPEAAKEAWERTLVFFAQHLKAS
jgi:carboxymethylenebutenolidase